MDLTRRPFCKGRTHNCLQLTAPDGLSPLERGPLLPSSSECMQAQIAAKQLRKAAQEAEERVAQEDERQREAQYKQRVAAVLQQGPPAQWHGLRKHDW